MSIASRAGSRRSRLSIGSPLKPVDLLLYRTRPVAKVDGVSTEAVVSRVSAINDPDAQTRANAERLPDSFFQGLLARSRGSNPPLSSELAVELELYIRSKISTPQMLSTLFPRGYLAAIDPNVWEVEAPLITKTGAAILGIRWSRIARHDYVNFQDQVPSHVQATKLVCNAGDFGGLISFVADGTNLIADIESLDGGLPAGTRWGISATLNAAAGGVVLGGQVTTAQARSAVHPGAHFTTLKDGSLMLDPPIPLVNQDELLGSILAVDILPDAQVGDTRVGTSAIAPLRNVGFSVVKTSDLKANTLVSLSSPAWPKASPNSISSGWVRIAKCEPKVISVQSYMKPVETNGAAKIGQNLVSLLEQDREENVCIFGRIISSGSKATNASLGPASPTVFRLPSSVSPQIPTIKSVSARPWNVEVKWVAETASGQPVYNDDTQFQVGLECIELGTSASPSLRGGADLATILSRIVSGGWPNDDDEWETVADWLANRPAARSAVGTPPRFDDVPKAFSNPGAGSFLISPSGSKEPSLDWTGQEADILQWRRENFLWRIRLRAITNPNEADFAIFSDWTLPAGPVAALPLVPQLKAGVNPTPIAYSRPTIAILVDYTTQYRLPSEFSTLTYQLVVRKSLIVPNPSKRLPGDHDTAPCSERIVQPSAPQQTGNKYLWRFQYIDREIAPHEKYGDNPTFAYEIELQQLRILTGSSFVVTKSEVCSLPRLDPNTSLHVSATEPSYG
jgi:hypothetical protein